MGRAPALMVIDTAPSLATTPLPSHMTVTISTAGDALPFIVANVSAYGVGNPASLHHGEIVLVAANASKFVFGFPTIRDNQAMACSFLLDPSKPWVLLNVDRTGGGRLMSPKLLVLI